MRYLTYAAALAALLGLSACAGTTSTQTQLAAACQSYASLLSTAALNKDALSAEEVNTVDQVRSVANPICTDLSGVEDSGQALTTLRNATRQLEAVTNER
jgi:hypothetical protein